MQVGKALFPYRMFLRKSDVSKQFLISCDRASTNDEVSQSRWCKYHASPSQGKKFEQDRTQRQHRILRVDSFELQI